MGTRWMSVGLGALSLLYVALADDELDRTGIAAGSPIPIELMKRLIETLNLRELTNAYGMSK